MMVAQSSSVVLGSARRPYWLQFLGILFVLYAIFLTVHWQPFGFSSNLDESWNAALNRAFAAEMQFGKDFVYTYGPYGFLLAPRSFPETYSDLMVGRLFIGLVMGIGLFSLGVYCWNTHAWSTLFLVPFLFFFPNSGIPLDSFFVTLVTLPLLLYFYVNQGKLTFVLLLLLIGSALVGLVKHTYLTLGGFFMLLIAIDEVFHRRRFPVILMVYGGAVLGFWVLAGQSLGNFFPFLINSSEMVKGFSEAMGTPGPVIEIVSYLISVGFFFGLMGMAILKRRNTFEFLPIIGLALIFFLIFKGSFVRHDAHAIHSATTTIPIACLFSALLWPSVSQLSVGIQKLKIKIPFILISWLVLFMNASLIFQHYTNHGYPQYFSQAIAYITITGNSALRHLSSQSNLQGIYKESLENIRKNNPLPEISGTTDLYPFGTAVIFAYGLPYKPRPVIQSFAAYTGKLAELNAAHLRAAEAPESILFAVQTIDNRWPSSDDGLSWPELLTRYDIRDMTTHYLLLKRRAIPLNYSIVPLKEHLVKMQEWIELPEDSQSAAIWMKLDARPTLIGKLTTTLFRLPPLYLEVETADGRLQTYRILADIANSGHLLSPLVKDSLEFAFLASQSGEKFLNNSRIRRMRLVTENWGALAYPQYYLLTLSRLDFPRQDFSLVPGWADYLAFAPIMNGKIQKGEVRIVKRIDGRSSKPVLFAHADSRIVLPFSEGSQKMLVHFGILDGAWQGAKEKSWKADGVEFRVVAIFPDRREEILFSRWLDPHAHANDRGEKKGEIDLKDITPQELALETLKGPRDNSSWDWSYWSDFRFDPQEP